MRRRTNNRTQNDNCEVLECRRLLTQTLEPFSLDASGDNRLDVLTDGILVTRWMAGFTGTTLVDEIQGLERRISGEEIDAFLSQHATAFDVDLDGSVSALSDGIVLSRYLAGFHGDQLTDGINLTGSRTTQEIQTHLGAFHPLNHFTRGSVQTQVSESTEIDIQLTHLVDDVFSLKVSGPNDSQRVIELMGTHDWGIRLEDISAVPHNFELPQPAAIPAQTTIATPNSSAPNWENEFQSFESRLNEGEIDVVFLGDSLTSRWNLEGQVVWEQLLPKEEKLNGGIGGDRTQNLKWRIENSALDSTSPDLAIIHIGTNNICWPRRGECAGADSVDDTVAGIVSTVRATQDRLPNTKILLLGILPRNEFNSPLRDVITQVNQRLAMYADGDEISFLDIGNSFVDVDGGLIEGLMFDDLHLTESGYAQLAEALQPAIYRLLRQELPISISPPKTLRKDNSTISIAVWNRDNENESPTVFEFTFRNGVFQRV